MKFDQHQLDAISYLTWDHLRKSCVFPAYEPPVYSFKNRGVKMPPERKEYPVTHYATGVYVGSKYITRDEVARAQSALAEMDAAEERRKAEEQKKKEEEAKRQATIALRAKIHMTKRHTWLLLDPTRVREALAYADKYGNMVALDEDGTMGHDPADLRQGDQPAGAFLFCPGARR